MMASSLPDPFRLFLLPGISKEICGSASQDMVYEVISQSGTTLIISYYALVRSQGCVVPLTNQISPLNKAKSCIVRDIKNKGTIWFFISFSTLSRRKPSPCKIKKQLILNIVETFFFSMVSLSGYR